MKVICSVAICVHVGVHLLSVSEFLLCSYTLIVCNSFLPLEPEMDQAMARKLEIKQVKNSKPYTTRQLSSKPLLCLFAAVKQSCTAEFNACGFRLHLESEAPCISRSGSPVSFCLKSIVMLVCGDVIVLLVKDSPSRFVFLLS